MKSTVLLMLLLYFCTFLKAQQIITQRQITLLEKMRRPNDCWPRSDGHALIAEPGSPLQQKGYYEPGGSFSPSPGSFGIAIWVTDQQGKKIITSDEIPMALIHQRYTMEPNQTIPAIITSTPYYRCKWELMFAGRWQLHIDSVQPNQRIALVIRSVGPAGGPVKSMYWDSTRLMINRQFNLVPATLPSKIIIGDEQNGSLQQELPFVQTIESAEGWAFARLLFSSNPITLAVTDTRPQFGSTLPYTHCGIQFTMDLPDKDFEQSLQAQISNLMMGYISQQTGPGEPINYPLAWERDGAYSLQAMAKSGNLSTAKALSVYFAENDFFGGFGAEGDAAGSAINALTELAFLLNDDAYYNWVWPHIKRKLTIITAMMAAKENVYRNFVGPLVPHIANDVKRRQWICKPFEDGIIVGAMDNHFPALYTTAISYRGLIQASRLAIQLKDAAIADDCLKKAAVLKQGWNNNFGKKKYDNERNFMISMWPSWMTNSSYALYLDKLTDKHHAEWNGDTLKERPLWTYFTAAEAHQWLYLDKPDTVWKVLHYFWNNQCSPGLYTYWEGNGEENSFHGWDQYRGWLNPKYVTPHYWTASEMALLQLDMLVYVNEEKENYELVIGAGIPQSWLNQRIKITGFKTKAGTVDWSYENNKLSVTVHNPLKSITVRAGEYLSSAALAIKLQNK